MIRTRGLLHLLNALVVRYSRRHLMIALLNVSSVALGVAVYLAISVANHSANRSFQAGIDAVSGKSHLELRSSTGRLDETLFPRLRDHPDIAAITPLIESHAVLPDHPGEFLQLLGVDAFSTGPFRLDSPLSKEHRSPSGLDFETFLGRPGQITVSSAMAERYGWRPGDRLRLQIDGRNHLVIVAGYNPEGGAIASNAGDGSRHLAMMDIGWLQELLGEAGFITTLQIRLRDPNRWEESLSRIRAAVPPDTKLETPAQRSRQVGKMLSGFQLNLTALSLVAIFVGVFLIYSSVSASVGRRRLEIGTLRSLGASRGQVQALFLAEALASGLIGIVLGTFAGIALAGVLLEDVSRTISSLYLLNRIEATHVSSRHIARAAAFGLAACLAGAWFPSRQAACVDPVTVLRRGNLSADSLSPSARRAGLGAGAGALFLLTVSGAACFSALTAGPPWMSFAACFAWLAGFAAGTRWFSGGWGTLFHAVVRSSPSITWRIAAMEFKRSISRLSITAAGLMVAIAMMTGVTVMIASFRTTVDDWMNASLAADLYLTPASHAVIGREHFIPAPVNQFVAAFPAVRRVTTFREIQVNLSGSGESVSLGVIDGDSLDQFRFAGRSHADRVFAFQHEGAVLVSEPFLERHGFSRSLETLELATPAGGVSFPVAGVFYDYSRDRGMLYLHRNTFRLFWKDERIQSLAIFLKEGVRAEEAVENLTEALRRHFGDEGTFLVLSNRAIRQRALAIFDQTFAVTDVLRAVAIVVAFLGIVLALTTLIHERQRQIAVLRAVGASRSQIGLVFLAQAANLGLASSIIGTLCGLGLAVQLTWVLNKAFFGWTIHLHLPVSELLHAPVWITATAALAGLFPAIMAARQSIAEALRVD